MDPGAGCVCSRAYSAGQEGVGGSHEREEEPDNGRLGVGAVCRLASAGANGSCGSRMVEPGGNGGVSFACRSTRTRPKKTGRDLLNDGVASERKVSSEVDSRSAVPSEILRGSFGRLRAANLVVDAALFVVLALVTISGLGVSGAVLPAFGLYADGYYFWNPLHAAAAKALLALLIVHLAFHMKYVVVLLRRNHG